MEIKLVVFDLAGTTIHDNQDVHRILQGALNKFDVTISLDEANEVMGIPKPFAIKSLVSHQRPGWNASQEWIQEVHAVFVEDMIRFYQSDPTVSEKAGVSDTFQRLQEKGIQIAVNTGFDRAITGALLERVGWRQNGLIDVSVTSDEVPRGRPFPDMIFKAMALTHVFEPQLVAKVGDTQSDMEEGTAAGCSFVIGITSGAFSRERLLQTPHTHLIDTIPEVIDVLGLN
jgi:phosphonatase-like hydrolase